MGIIEIKMQYYQLFNTWLLIGHSPRVNEKVTSVIKGSETSVFSHWDKLFFTSKHKERDNNFNVWHPNTFSDPLRQVPVFQEHWNSPHICVCHWALEFTQLYSCFDVVLSSHLQDVFFIPFPLFMFLLFSFTHVLFSHTSICVYIFHSTYSILYIWKHSLWMMPKLPSLRNYCFLIIV